MSPAGHTPRTELAAAGRAVDLGAGLAQGGGQRRADTPTTDHSHAEWARWRR